MIKKNVQDEIAGQLKMTESDVNHKPLQKGEKTFQDKILHKEDGMNNTCATPKHVFFSSN